MLYLPQSVYSTGRLQRLTSLSQSRSLSFPTLIRSMANTILVSDLMSFMCKIFRTHRSCFLVLQIVFGLRFPQLTTFLLSPLLKWQLIRRILLMSRLTTPNCPVGPLRLMATFFTSRLKIL